MDKKQPLQMNFSMIFKYWCCSLITDKNMETFMITEDNRFDAVDKLFDGLDQIANNSNVEKQVPEVMERLMGLKKEGLLITYPTKKSKYTINSFVIRDYLETDSDADSDNVDNNSQIILYPMFPEDAQYGKLARHYTKRVSYASYGCRSNTITINMSFSSKETPRFLAHLFIHELGHAEAAKKEGRLFSKSLKPPNERLREETDMWTVDYRLMLAIGGSDYREAAKKMAVEIHQWCCKNRKCPDYRGRGIALKHCFGDLSDIDSNKERDRTFFYYCYLMFVDYCFDREKAKEIKLQIIQEIHPHII